MKVDQKKLKESLRGPAKIAGRKRRVVLIGALERLFILAEGGQGLNLISADCAVDVNSYLPLRAIELDANELGKAVDSVGKGEIEISQDGFDLTLSRDGFKVLVVGSPDDRGLHQRMSISDDANLMATDIPNLPLLLATAAKNRDESRAVMTGISFQEVEGYWQACATDGRRAAASRVPIEEAVGRFIVPAEAFSVFRKGTPISVFRDPEKREWSITGGGLTISGKEIGGRFPDLNRVIPSSGFTTKIIVDRKLFLESVKRLVPVAKRIPRSPFLATLKMGFCELGLACSDRGAGVFVEDSVALKEFYGNPLEIGLNLSYLQDFLSNVSEEFVVASFRGPDKGVLFSTPKEGLTYVQMPVRLRRFQEEEVEEAN